MRTLSSRALSAFYDQDGDEQVITLLKIYGANLSAPIYLADGWTKRHESLSTDDDVVYGVTSDGADYLFLPFQISLPGEEDGAGPRCNLTIQNATGVITPEIRALTSPPSVRVQVVIANSDTTVSTPEMEFDGFKLAGISYNAETVTGYLTVDGLSLEPFPSHTMTPSVCPGLF